MNFREERRGSLLRGLTAPRRWVRANVRGRGQLSSPTAPQHLKLPVTCCHRPAHRHFLRTRPDRSRLQRDAGQVGKKKDGRNLSVWRERDTRDLSRRELALNRALRSSAPLFFPLRKKTGGCEGRGRSLKRKRSASAERRD